MNDRRSKRTNLMWVTFVVMVTTVCHDVWARVDHPRFPELDLGGPKDGAGVIEAVGAGLPDVARWYGMDAAEFKALVERDTTLHADAKGRLLYRCAGRHGGACGQDAEPEAFSIPGTLAPPPLEAPFPLEQTFRLHSTPGASRVIYLDCGGRTITGSAWNSFWGSNRITAAPFDLDGDATVLSERELAAIQQIWQRVAEDYAPFDVDVTTEDPGDAAITRDSVSDDQFGMRVLLTSTTLESVGGIAYVGVFDEIGDSHKPVFVFCAPCGNDPAVMAEVCSHETGHTLGLFHDGTTTGSEYYEGDGYWAPIMGGSVGKTLTQWSKGEYAQANNKQDDLAVIQSHGLPYYPDDHGDSIADATPLVGPSLDAIGVIERSSDWDAFGFTSGAGDLVLALDPAPRGANLDIGAWLLDAAGNVLATSSPSDSLGATIVATVPGGQYYLIVFGVGTGDPLSSYSDYGSLGQYRLIGEVVDGGGGDPVDPTPVAPTAVMSVSTLSGTAPLPISFSAEGSTDVDGVIVSYSWSFGDGSVASSANASHTYEAAGSYTVSLTVEDDQGLTDTAAATILVEEPPQALLPMHVAAIELREVVIRRKVYIEARVQVIDAMGQPVVGAVVTGKWDGLVKNEDSATTGSNGVAVMLSGSLRKSGVVTFDVTDVSSADYTYDAAANTESSESVAYTK